MECSGRFGSRRRWSRDTIRAPIVPLDKKRCKMNPTRDAGVNAREVLTRIRDYLGEAPPAPAEDEEPPLDADGVAKAQADVATFFAPHEDEPASQSRPQADKCAQMSAVDRAVFAFLNRADRRGA
jgi:hypothetical protein